jgi:hypothetical protein
MLDDPVIGTVLFGMQMAANFLGYIVLVAVLAVLMPIWLPFWFLGLVGEAVYYRTPIDNDASLGG